MVDNINGQLKPRFLKKCIEMYHLLDGRYFALCLPKRTVLKYHPSWWRTVPKSSVASTWPPIRKKTPTGASLKMQIVMAMKLYKSSFT